MARRLTIRRLTYVDPKTGMVRPTEEGFKELELAETLGTHGTLRSRRRADRISGIIGFLVGRPAVWTAIALALLLFGFPFCMGVYQWRHPRYCPATVTYDEKEVTVTLTRPLLPGEKVAIQATEGTWGNSGCNERAVVRFVHGTAKVRWNDLLFASHAQEDLGWPADYLCVMYSGGIATNAVYRKLDYPRVYQPHR